MPAAKEDAWAFQPIGSPFPPAPVKCQGQQNMYVALWYKHGKPIHGRAWNNGGVVECSFPFLKVELKTKQELEGMIQVLQYKGDHNKLGFWYNWVPYKERFDHEAKSRESVRCGDSFPILWADRAEGALLGYVDNKTEVARFSCDGKVYEKSGPEIADMKLIVRELKGAPPGCNCTTCNPPAAPPKKRVEPTQTVNLNQWADYRGGDGWPEEMLIKALFKPLDTLAGQSPEQYVALWYQAGEPVMGRIWNDNGKIAASFGWGGHEYTTNVGSIQILWNVADHVRGFDYDWRPFPEAASFDKAKEWFPVHVNHHKGDISPGVLTVEGKQILGKVDIRNERASVAFGGKEHVFVGPAVHSVIVLCRKPRPGCSLDKL